MLLRSIRSFRTWISRRRSHILGVPRCPRRRPPHTTHHNPSSYNDGRVRSSKPRHSQTVWRMDLDQKKEEDHIIDEPPPRSPLIGLKSVNMLGPSGTIPPVPRDHPSGTRRRNTRIHVQSILFLFLTFSLALSTVCRGSTRWRVQWTSMPTNGIVHRAGGKTNCSYHGRGGKRCYGRNGK